MDTNEVDITIIIIILKHLCVP